MDDDRDSLDKKLIEGSGSAATSDVESEAESKPAARAASTASGGGDAFLEAVKGIADDAAGVDDADASGPPRPAPKVDAEDQYAPAPPGPSTSSGLPASSSGLPASSSSRRKLSPTEAPKPPHAPPVSRSSSRLSSRKQLTAEEEEERAEAEAEAKRAADDARRKEIVAELEQLSETLKLFEREHDFFYTGLAGYGVLIGVIVFISSWVAGLSGSLSLTTGSEQRDRVLKVTIAAAGVVSALFSTAQRAFSPSVRAEYYRAARDSYSRLRKKTKAALGANNDGTGESSLAALEATRRSVIAKQDELFERSPQVGIDSDGYPVPHGRVSYSVFLGFGALFYPCAACCSPAGPKKPSDGRGGGGGGGGRDDFV